MQNRVLKRQEIILPLMKEFIESPSLKLAKDILENKPLYPEKRIGWNIIKEDHYTKSNLSVLLRKRQPTVASDGMCTVTCLSSPIEDPSNIDGPIRDKGENEIRESFDAFLDFFGKLGYLLDIGVISKKEISFFLYFIRKTIDDKAIINYVDVYDFQMFAILLDKLNMLPKELSRLKDSYREQIDVTKSRTELLGTNIRSRLSCFSLLL
jgi:hypothetical protein